MAQALTELLVYLRANQPGWNHWITAEGTLTSIRHFRHY